MVRDHEAGGSNPLTPTDRKVARSSPRRTAGGGPGAGPSRREARQVDMYFFMALLVVFIGMVVVLGIAGIVAFILSFIKNKY